MLADKSAARACLKELGVASLFLRFNPLDTSSKTAAECFDDLTVERIRRTYLVNIVEPEHMWDRLRSSCRSRIRKARKNGYTGQVRPAGAADLAPGSAFRRRYEQTMQRRSATPQYYFSDDYYVELLAGLGSDLLPSRCATMTRRWFPCACSCDTRGSCTTTSLAPTRTGR
ncbi:MAG: family N-acetyltransferase [Mycobacterium sp.]|nr:family N-acetyltransferase [Mycobacterium sp.]